MISVKHCFIPPSVFRVFMDSDENNSEMAPKTPEKDSKAKVDNSGNILDTVSQDLDEIDLVSSSLDSLNSALDSIEERADNMRAQLLELLNSNREILKELREEYKPEEHGSKSNGNSTSNGSA